MNIFERYDFLTIVAIYFMQMTQVLDYCVLCWLLQGVLNTSETIVNMTMLAPFTKYTISIACLVAEATHGYWSDDNVTLAQTAQSGWFYNFVLYHSIVLYKYNACQTDFYNFQPTYRAYTKMTMTM